MYIYSTRCNIFENFQVSPDTEDYTGMVISIYNLMQIIMQYSNLWDVDLSIFSILPD